MQDKPIGGALKYEAKVFRASGVEDFSLWHEVAVDLWFPVVVTATGNAPGLPPDAYRLYADFELDPQRLGYQCSGLTLNVSADSLKDHEIDAARLRMLSIPGILDHIGDEVGRSTEELPKTARAGSYLSIRARNDGVDLDERLAEVSRIYAREFLSGRKPAKAVSAQMGAPSSTAGYWIRRAKDLGYIRSGTSAKSEVPDASAP